MRLLIASSIFPKVVFDSLTAQIRLKAAQNPYEYKIAKYASDGEVDQMDALKKSADAIRSMDEKYCGFSQKVFIDPQ